MEFFHHQEGPASLSRLLGGQAGQEEAHCALRLPHGYKNTEKEIDRSIAVAGEIIDSKTLPFTLSRRASHKKEKPPAGHGKSCRGF